MRRARKDAYRPLSESPLWAANRRYYQRTGIDAWRTATVPHYVTNNVPLATAYARIVLAFLADADDEGVSARSGRSRLRRGRPAGGHGGRPEPPIHVVEIGAGCGRFAFLFLRALEALQRQAPAAMRPPVRYVMTDVAPRTLAFWRSHEALAPFVRDGRLDFARFDAETDESLRLEHARRTLGPGGAARIVVIANYVLDSLRHDAFVIRAGRLHTYLAATTLPPRRRTAADVSMAWRDGGRVEAPYPDDDFNAILRDYAASAGAGRVVFPVGALRCLARLAALAREDVLVLAADRGTADAADAVARPADLELARHGSVSLPVNFHALRTWTSRRGGEALAPSRPHRHLHIAAFLLGTSARGWDETRLAYAQTIRHGGPDELYSIRRGLTAVADQLGAADLLALIRLCGDDPRVVAECIRPLWRHLADAGARLRLEIREAALAAWANYFHLGEPYDLAFNLALLLYETRAYVDAYALFEESMRLYGEDGATRWNLGLCQVALGKPDEAMASFQRARMLAPDLYPAGLAVAKHVPPPSGRGGRPEPPVPTGSRLSSAARDTASRQRPPRAARR